MAGSCKMQLQTHTFKKNVLLGNVGKDKGDVGLVLGVAENTLNDLKVGGDTYMGTHEPDGLLNLHKQPSNRYLPVPPAMRPTFLNSFALYGHLGIGPLMSNVSPGFKLKMWVDMGPSGRNQLSMFTCPYQGNPRTYWGTS